MAPHAQDRGELAGEGGRRRILLGPRRPDGHRRMATGQAEPVVGVEDGPADGWRNRPRPQVFSEPQDPPALPGHIGRPEPRHPIGLEVQ